jgi:hypothetical protein
MVTMRDDEVIRREMDSAKDLADELEDTDPMDALAAMVVYRTLKWVTGEGKESLDDELLEISDDE